MDNPYTYENQQILNYAYDDTVQSLKTTQVINSSTDFNDLVSNNRINVNPYLLDEYGTQSQMSCDNLFTGAAIAISPEHHEIHCGDSYVLTRITDLTNGASDNLIIVVPNETGSGQTQKLYHLVPIGGSESEAIWYLYEGVTTTSLGTSIPFYNRERNSANVTGLTAYHSPTITSDGTLLMTKHQGSGRGVGSDARTEEFVLKNNTAYLLRVTNQTANNNYISWELNHYVHPGI
jgi:hypothetical protein